MEHDISLNFTGLSLPWALVLLAICTGATIYAYSRCAAETTRARRFVMVGLRLGISAIFVLLFAQPVLNMTLHEPVRQRLPVLLDVSQSLAVKDRRDRPDDLKRAALAVGMIDPKQGLHQDLAFPPPSELVGISRCELLQKLSANPKLALWHRLQLASALAFAPFGREATPAGFPAGTGPNAVDGEAVTDFLKGLSPDKPATAIGDAVRQIIQENQERPIGGIVLVTDGQNNAGSSPIEAARFARERNIPLFIYGVGVTAAPDLILEEIRAQKLAFAKELFEVRAKVRVQGMSNVTVSATLKVNGSAEDQQTLAAGEEGEYEIVLHFTPQEAGECKLEVALAPLPEEIDKGNNTATARLRVTNSRFQVLLIEQEPRWDFRYLLAYLQRDRRLNVHCVMIDGERDLDRGADSPFLSALPADREEFFRSQVLILGDVKPEDLGEQRMQIIQEWVEAGGGIIFLAGSRNDPSAYAGTPLEPLLPVVPDTDSSPESARRTPEPFKLQLTPSGETSPYLQMAPDAEENRRVWDAFPGVRWTAAVARAKPGAEVLLVDPRPEQSGRYGAPPVFALQGYGAGTCVYIGTDETYRWRSRVGEKYYSILWGQIMQSLALQLLEGGSAHTQLRTDRARYTAGDKVIISGKAYLENFQPLLVPSLEGEMTVATSDADGRNSTRKQSLTLSYDPDTRNYRGEFTSGAPGEYSFSTRRDPETFLRFEVSESRLEKIQTALNERLLKAMAEISGGRFLREEDLDQLPALVRARAVTVSTLKRIELFHSPWWLAALLLLAFIEWLLRRLNQLK